MIKLKKLIKESNVWDRKFGEPLPTLKNVVEKHEESVKEDLDPYKDFGSDQFKPEYNLNLGAFVEHYQKFMKFMKKHKEVPDKNKREWALAIRRSVSFLVDVVRSEKSDIGVRVLSNLNTASNVWYEI